MFKFKIKFMKNLLPLALLFLIFSCAKEEKPIDYAILHGKITNADGGKFIIGNSEKKIAEITLNNDGTFTDTLKNISAGYYSFKYANESSKLYLKPGDNLTLILNPEQFDESIVYQGSGSTENNYLAKKFLNEEALGDLNSYRYLGTLEEKIYVQKMDSIKKLEQDFLGKQNDLNSDFVTLEEAAITYGHANNLNQYEAYKRYVAQNPDFEVSSDYPDYSTDLNVENEKLWGVDNYKNYWSYYYNKKAAKLAKSDSISEDLAFLQLVASEVKSPKIKNDLLYSSAKYGITYTNKLQKYYDLFIANSTDENHKKEITEKYNLLIKLAKGEPSPTFENYENFAGGTTSLSDLKGKYVYVDVWATWCGPCKREIPSLKEMGKKYHDKNIAFVSMSIDRKVDYDKWRKMVEEESLTGIQLFAPDDWNSDFVKNYSILGIPRFILIDPAGNIVNSNAPRPSSEELPTLFDSLEI
jgi:thiol-disulfide isomerase/thioredoxin